MMGLCSTDTLCVQRMFIVLFNVVRNPFHIPFFPCILPLQSVYTAARVHTNIGYCSPSSFFLLPSSFFPLQSVYTAARVIRLDGKAAVMDETGLAGVLSRYVTVVVIGCLESVNGLFLMDETGLAGVLSR